MAGSKESKNRRPEYERRPRAGCAWRERQTNRVCQVQILRVQKHCTVHELRRLSRHRPARGDAKNALVQMPPKQLVAKRELHSGPFVSEMAMLRQQTVYSMRRVSSLTRRSKRPPPP